jgi:hypothetical protein
MDHHCYSPGGQWACSGELTGRHSRRLREKLNAGARSHES